MKVTKKIIWLMVSLLMVLSLVVASCGPKEKEEEVVVEEEEVVVEEEEVVVEEEEAVVTEEKEMVRNSLGRLVEKPEYGGIIVIITAGSPSEFEEAYSRMGCSWAAVYTNEGLLTGDWTKGPSGSGEVTWRYSTFPPPSILTGLLAESWEIVDDQTMVFHIRKGVYFHNKPPTNGRELNANDVVYSLMRTVQTRGSYLYTSHGVGRTLESITAPDKWTVVLKSMPGQLYNLYWGYLCNAGAVIAREVVEQYGDSNVWKNNCGTGPFIMTDYVPDSVLLYEKNPNYWRKNPLHPENTMPYVDKLKILIIADESSRLAAFRTGKIDVYSGLTFDNESELKKRNPNLIWEKYLTTAGRRIAWRSDQPETQFYDVKVRRALSMAVDRQAIANEYYSGDAEVLVSGCCPIPELTDYYTPLEELPESAREVYTYNPEKAKALLKEAGYPNGFQTKVFCTASDVDLFSIIKGYWDAVDVDLELSVVESGALNSILNNKAYSLIASMNNPQRPEALAAYTPGQSSNHAMVDDPRVTAAALKGLTTFLTDRPTNIKLIKDTLVYIFEQAFYFDIPIPYNYIGWWPWVKGYNGEISCGARNSPNDYPKYLWIDWALKKSIGY